MSDSGYSSFFSPLSKKQQMKLINHGIKRGVEIAFDKAFGNGGDINMEDISTRGVMHNPVDSRCSRSRFVYKSRKSTGIRMYNSPEVHWHDIGTPEQPLTTAGNDTGWYISDGRNASWRQQFDLRGNIVAAMGDATNNLRENSLGRIPVLKHLKSVHTFRNANPQTCEIWIYDMIAKMEDRIEPSPSNLLGQFNQAITQSTDFKAAYDSFEFAKASWGVSIQTAGGFLERFKICNVTHKVLEPGQMHKHQTNFTMNMKCDVAVQKNTAIFEYPRINKGYTHFIVVKHIGTLGHLNTNIVGGTQTFNSGVAANTGTKIDHWHEFWGVTGFSEDQQMKIYYDLDKDLSTTVFPAANVVQLQEEDPVDETG